MSDQSFLEAPPQFARFLHRREAPPLRLKVPWRPLQIRPTCKPGQRFQGNDLAHGRIEH